MQVVRDCDDDDDSVTKDILMTDAVSLGKHGKKRPRSVSTVSSSKQTVCEYREKLLQLGYLPSKHRYTLRAALEKRVPDLISTWFKLYTERDAAVQADLQKLLKLERAFDREGHPDGWGNVQTRLEWARSVRSDVVHTLELLDESIALLERHTKLRNGLKSWPIAPTQAEASATLKVCFDWQHLPLDLQLMVVTQHLEDPKDLAALACSCHAMTALMQYPVLWKRLLAKFWAKRGCKNYLRTMLHQTPLINLFGVHDPYVLRELYLRLWFSYNTSTCGLCRSEPQQLGAGQHERGGWSYKCADRRVDGVMEAITPAWHFNVVEQACQTCQGLWLLPDSQLKKAGLVADILTPRLYCFHNGKYHTRVFLEDALRSTMDHDWKLTAYDCSDSGSENEDEKPHPKRFQTVLDAIPLIRIRTDSTVPTANERYQCWRDMKPAVFQDTNTPNHRLTQWMPSVSLDRTTTASPLKKKQKRGSVPPE